MNILNKEFKNIDDIKSIIENRLEESTYIEFKSSKSLENNDKNKKEIAKDVSAFANSDGGIIFYGIDEDNHVASSISYIDGSISSKEWLENVIISRVKRKILNLKIIPIRNNNNISETVYVVLIPASEYSPHMVDDGKYYRRHNFQVQHMDEYEVRNSYFRTKESKILFYDTVCKPNFEKNTRDELYFYLEFQIKNVSNIVCEKYKISCNILHNEFIKITSDEYLIIKNDVERGITISSGNISPIFPDEIVNGLSFRLIINRYQFENLVHNYYVSIILRGINYFQEEKIEIGNLIKAVKEEYG